MTRYRIVPISSSIYCAWRLEEEKMFGWDLIAAAEGKQKLLDLLAHLRQPTEYYPPLESK